ncbi:MAG: phosphogluconate dehydrogenase (NADP(+)-dependent, decarboxylating) [Proteobacteria bacterium]|nr:MAG: phosphogluconate dehydrogenase (NADP(+)-dependent, decarboxylating) [Pseudomonadota bacterium]
MIKQNADFGLIGLGVMGKSLLLNIADHGYRVIGYDKDTDKVKDLTDSGIVAVETLKDFVQGLAKPRKIMMLLPAGEIVDKVIAEITSLLEKGDILMDGGNTFFKDTERRQNALKPIGIDYLGIGISGGEAGARNGPSMMPSGNQSAYRHIEPILTAISAKAQHKPCVAYLGEGGAGHYVKMVHNGIEYALMQVLAEVYDIMKRGVGLSNQQISDIFADWNAKKLQSFLLEISVPLLTQKDTDTDSDLIDLILDKGKQKGTGKWTSQNALDVGEAVPMIDVAVIARALSSVKEQRLLAAELLQQDCYQAMNKKRKKIIKQLKKATYFAFLLAYAQGFALLQSAKKEYGYTYNLAEVASIWRGGCIIRAKLLSLFKQAFRKTPSLPNPLLDAAIAAQLNKTENHARTTLLDAVQCGLPVLCLGAGVAYFDSYRCPTLPANLIQAQRDFFGAHTYERVDKKGVFHTQWEKS